MLVFLDTLITLTTYKALKYWLGLCDFRMAKIQMHGQERMERRYPLGQKILWIFARARALSNVLAGSCFYMLVI